ncbi:hypothetical protein [Cardinium endosymbiont of Nabis limbatus]
MDQIAQDKKSLFKECAIYKDKSYKWDNILLFFTRN